VCPSICPVETVEGIQLMVVGVEASFYFSYIVLKGKWAIFKNKGSFLWSFVPNSGL